MQLKHWKRVKKLKNKPVSDSSAPLQSSGQYMVETELLGIVATLPLSCRDIIFSQRGLVAQLAVIALMEKEKHGKNYQRLKRAVRRSHLLVRRILRKLQPKAKNKITRKVLKRSTRKGRLSVVGLLSKRVKLKKSSKVKPKAKKKATLKKKRTGFGAKGRVKSVKKAINKKLKVGRKKAITKSSAKGLSKLIVKKKLAASPSKAGKVAKVKKTVKGKLSFLTKPSEKDIDKFKKMHAKKVKARALQKTVLTKKIKQRAKIDEEKTALKTKVSFFKQSGKSKAANLADTKQNLLK